jgi:hypothetical protein
MLKSVLMITLLSVVACACQYLPPKPDVWQCAYRNDKQAFYCVQGEKKLKIPESGASMKNAQCVSLKDYNKLQAWIESIKQNAEQRCH